MGNIFKKYAFSLLVVMVSLLLNSCGLYYRLHKTKAEKAQQKADNKKEDEWEKRQKIKEQNRKRVYAMQTKDTRKRMRESQRKSNRINSNRAPKQHKTYHLPKIFRPSKWWR